MPSPSDSNCKGNQTGSCSPSLFQIVLVFFSIYLVAAAQSSHVPCAQAFGADQFDSDDKEESKAKSSFFNWWYFGVGSGVLMATLVVSCIQENLSWSLGFGVPCVVMIIGSLVFLLGTKTYRFNVTRSAKGPFIRIGRVFVAAFKNRQANPSLLAEENSDSEGNLSHQFKYLNKALSSQNEDWLCSATEVEEAKAVLRLLPIWGSCLIFGIVFAQVRTFFIKQAATVERTIFLDFEIPAASVFCIVTATIIASLPIYERILVPITRYFTGKSFGITTLQRIGTGIFISLIAMMVAAVVEIKRLEIAKEHGLVDDPNATLPMSIWWLAPQNVLYGVADVFTMVGMQEFFYDQVPTELRSIGNALCYSVIGAGSFLSSFLVSIIEQATGRGDSWFPNNLNSARLDCFYWLIVGLGALWFAAYLHFAKSYVYNKWSTKFITSF